MPKYLVEEKKGRWGHKKYVYTAFMEVKLPDGTKKLFRLKQTGYPSSVGVEPRPKHDWRLTKGHMKTFFKHTKPQHWQLRHLSDFDGMIDMVVRVENRSWRTPQFEGRGTTVLWDLQHMDYHYDWKEKGGYIHCWSNAVGSYDLKPRFPMRILPEVPASALKKAQKTMGKTEIPRLGTAKEVNVFLMYPSERVARLNKIQRVLKAVQQRKREDPTPAELRRIKKREAHAIKEKTKIEKIIAMSRKKRKT